MYLLFQYHGHKYKYLREIMNKSTTNIVNLLNYFISSRFKYAYLPLLYVFADCVSPSPVYNAVVGCNICWSQACSDNPNMLASDCPE